MYIRRRGPIGPAIGPFLPEGPPRFAPVSVGGVFGNPVGGWWSGPIRGLPRRLRVDRPGATGRARRVARGPAGRGRRADRRSALGDTRREPPRAGRPARR